MRSPEDSPEPTTHTRRFFLSSSISAVAGLATTLGYGKYVEAFDEVQAWEKIPEPHTVIEERDKCHRRIVGTIQDVKNGVTEEHFFVGDGFTVVTGGREFHIEKIILGSERCIKTENVLPKLDPEGIRTMKAKETDVFWYGPRGMITVTRADVLKIFPQLQKTSADKKDRKPVVIDGISYVAEAEIKEEIPLLGGSFFVGKVTQPGTCSVEFLETDPPPLPSKEDIASI